MPVDVRAVQLRAIEGARQTSGLRMRGSQPKEPGAYLAFDLPVPLFAETEAPGDDDAALRAVKAYPASPAPSAKPQAMQALQTLVRLNYQPTLLKQSGRPKAAVGAKKKISGG